MAEPLLASPSPAPPDSLSARINTATRHIHIEVNRLITARVPLALPPNSDTLEAYLHGIHAFARLYYTFEDAWQDLIIKTISKSGKSSDPIHTYLSELIDLRLWRTDRIDADIAHLQKTLTLTLPLTDPSTSEPFTSIKSHITSAVTSKPHTLLAYAWVLYMAIFSGGRHIRAELDSAPSSFWASADPQAGRSMFSFAGGQDGEDIKAEFKRRFRAADDLLSEAQKLDVLAEADEIFAMVVRLVAALDERLATPVEVGRGKETLEAVRHRRAKKTGTSETTKTEEEEPWMRQVGQDRRVQKALEANHPNTYLTEDVPFIPGLIAVAAGLALWYFLWSLGLKERLLSHFD